MYNNETVELLNSSTFETVEAAAKPMRHKITL